MSNFQVIVGNIGMVEDTDRLQPALEAYADYVRQSRTGYGRASYEEVRLMRGGEIWKEFYPPPLDENGAPIWQTSAEVVRAWATAYHLEQDSPRMHTLIRMLQPFKRCNDEVSDAWWVVDDVGASGPYDEEAALDVKTEEQFILCAQSEEAAHAEFLRLVKEGE